MKFSPSKARTGALLTAASLALAVGTAAAPSASAVVVAVDRPSINSANLDFGSAWAAGAPTSGAVLRWDVNAAGSVAPWLNGTLFITNMACGRVQVQYFDAAHVQLATRTSVTRCAPGAGLAAFAVAITSYRDPSVSHVHVNVIEATAAGPVVAGTALEWL